MKLSNEKRRFYFQIVNTLFIIAVLIIAFGMFIYYGQLKYQLVTLGAATLFAYILHRLRGYPFFVYDSDGETLNFTNKDFYLMFGDPKVVKRAEFPKRKLLAFKISNNLYNKKLKLILQTKRTESERTKQTFDLTYLSRSEIKDLKKSLEKVVQQNKKLMEDQ